MAGKMSLHSLYSASVKKCEDLLSDQGQGTYCVFHSLGVVVRKIIRGFSFTKCY